MTLDDWLKMAKADAEARELPDLVPLLEALARSTAALREADAAHRMRAEPDDPEDGQPS
jgi:hypothetical protein